ncbi:MAG TPA: phage holin family protein [Mycobacteriales bacterium]|nr:phage holin family protein [Mycobacteriales bacterium]
MSGDVEQETTAPHDALTGGSLGDLARDAAEHLSTLVRGEVELARLELAASVRRLGLGSAFFGAAATLLFFSLFFPFIALAEGLVTVGLPRWGAYLVAWAAQVLLAGVAAFIGVRMVRRIRRPERTLQAVRDTARLARHPTRAGAADAPDPDHGPA